MHQSFLGGWKAARQIRATAALVGCIAIACLQQDIQASPSGIVNDRIQPCEIISSLDLLRLGPAPLQSDGLDAQRHDVFLILLIISKIAVEGLAPQCPIRPWNLICAAWLNRADLLEPWVKGCLRPIRQRIDLRSRHDYIRQSSNGDERQRAPDYSRDCYLHGFIPCAFHLAAG